MICLSVSLGEGERPSIEAVIAETPWRIICPRWRSSWMSPTGCSCPPTSRPAELDAFNQMLAVSETAAHLDVLCAQGRIRARAERGIWSYSIGA